MSLPEPTAYFLGAGASAPFGFPVTSGLLPQTLSGLADDTLFSGINSRREERRDMKFLLAALRRLLPGWTPKTDPRELPLITEVLSLVDYCIGEGKPLFPGRSSREPGQTLEDSLRVRRLLERAIYEVLWEADPTAEHHADLLGRFRQRIADTTTPGGGVITTNYDTCLEQGFFDEQPDRVHETFDFGIPWLDCNSEERWVHQRPEKPRLRWLKLHGSLNWARCPVCEHVFINPYGDIAHQTFRRQIDDNNRCHCGDGSRLELHLVAPSTHRTVRDPNLLEVWKGTLQLLLEARHWVFIGYSLPSEDIAIRSLLIRAMQARAVPPRVSVVQRSPESLPRFRLLFPQCDYWSEGLLEWLKA